MGKKSKKQTDGDHLRKDSDWLWLCRNRIVQWKDSYKCILCTYEFEKGNVKEMKIHVRKSPFHVEGSIINTKDCELKDSTGQEATPDLLEKIVKNSIFFNPDDNQLTCYLCQYTLPFYSNVLDHVNDPDHLQKMCDNESSSSSQTYIFTSLLSCKKCNIYCHTPMVALKHVMEHFPKILKCSTSIDVIKVLESQILCSLCKINIAYEELEEHVESEQHVKRSDFLNSENHKPNEHKISKSEKSCMVRNIFKYFNSWWCNTCEKPIINDSALIGHFVGKRHRSKLKEKKQCSDHLINDIPSYSHKCYLCARSFGSNIIALFFHYMSVKHRTKIENFDKIGKESYLTIKEWNDTIFVECSLCQIQINDVESVIMHINEGKHKSCEILNEQLPISQIESYETQSEKREKNKEIETSQEESEKLEVFESASTSKESKDDELDELINNLNELLLNKRKINRFVPVHKRESKSSKNQMDKVSKFDQNILNNGAQYIDFCIKQGKRNIYNISISKLAHINLNINFIIKMNDNQFCLLCNNQFSSELNVIMEHIFGKEHIENVQKQNSSLMNTENASIISDDNLTLITVPYVLKITNESFHCHACKNDIAEHKVFEHSLTQDHILKCQDLKNNACDTLQKIMTLLKDTWYYTQFFACKVCEVEYQMEIEFVKHLKNKKHCKKVEKCIAKGDILEFHICFACVTCIYGDISKYYDHCEDIFHKRYLKKGDYKISKMMPPLIGLLNEIEDKKQKILNESDLIILESPKERSLLKAVEKVVESVYPTATAYKFGSRCSYTALSNSDLDIFLDCDDMYNKNFNAESCKKYLSAVKECFENHKDVWYIEEVLYETRVPIIKLRHYPTDFKCDISFSNGLAHIKSKLVRYYNDAYGICRELILYLKKWVIFSQLSGSEGISTFTVSWLVIFYLQFIGVFPSVYELQQSQPRSMIIDGWECGYKEDFCANPNEFSFVEHLVGLFTFYAQFDYQKYVICPYLGSIIEKEKFSTGELPAKLTALLSKRKKEAVSLFRFDSPMCMQDPTDLSENSTKALRKRQLRCFREYCSSSIEIIISGHQDKCL
ncbi:hypothetical protein TKK_0018467 [Trichogramma kaykai]|uniref:C2H2-type domain-containing protein n=1 Tax=Trichogramma kaykai TaxID=54128 RepID=A0ABD2VY20_9HYME